MYTKTYIICPNCGYEENEETWDRCINCGYEFHRNHKKTREYDYDFYETARQRNYPPSYTYRGNTNEVKPKDTFMGLILSIICPGLGLLYLGFPLRGIASFIIVFLAFYWWGFLPAIVLYIFSIVMTQCWGAE